MPRLESLLADSLRLPEERITDDLDMSSAESWDSLAHMEMIAAIEQAYGLELTRDDIVVMTDVATIRRVITRKQAAD